LILAPKNRQIQQQVHPLQESISMPFLGPGISRNEFIGGQGSTSKWIETMETRSGGSQPASLLSGVYSLVMGLK